MVTFEDKDTELLEQLLFPHSMAPTTLEPTLVLHEQKIHDKYVYFKFNFKFLEPES